MATIGTFKHTIAARLILLVAVVAAPLVGLQLYFASDEADSARTEALERSLWVAQTVKGRIEDHLRTVDSLLVTVAEAIPARRNAIDQGNTILRRIKAGLPAYFGSISVLEPDGTMLYSAENPPPKPGSINVRDRRYFTEALSTGVMAVGDPIVSRTSGKRILVFARPVLDNRTGAIRGVVSTSTLLERFQQIFAQEQLPQGSVITLIDRSGVILARSVDPEKWVGINVSQNASLQQAFQQAFQLGEGTRESASLDGTQRLAGFTKLEQVPWLVYVGIPADTAMASARERVFHLLLLTLAVSVLAIGVASWIARDIARPLSRLAHDAAELAGGRLSHRSQVRSYGEVGALANSFNAMAGAVEQQSLQLAESEAHARATFEQAAVGIAHITPDGRLLLVNQRLCEILGYTHDELLTHNLQQIIHPDDLDRDKHLVKQLRESVLPTPSYSADLRYLRKDGSFTWVCHTISLVRTDAGKTDNLISVVEDITERKRNQALIAGQKQVLETMARGAPLDETLTALVEVIESQSPDMLCSVLLLDDDGFHLRHGAAPSLPAEYIQAIDGSPIGARAGSCGTAAFRRKPVIVEDIEQDPLWEDYRALALPHGLRSCWSTPILDSAGRVLGTFAIYYRKPCRPSPLHIELIQVATHTAAIAISHKHAEQLLKNERALLHQVTTCSPVGITVVNREGNIMLANPAAQQMLGLSGDKMTQRVFAAPAWSVTHTDGSACPVEDMPFARVMASGKPLFDAEYSLQWPDDRQVQLSVNAAPLRTADNALDGVVVVVSDITERKRAEARILELNAELEQRVEERTAQLEAANRELEAFSYLVSHDLKAPLRGIDGYSQLLEEDFHDMLGEEGGVFVRNIRQGAAKMHELIEDLLAYSRIERRSIDNSALNLPACVQAVTQQYAQDLAERGVILNINVPDLTIHADRDGLAIALRNIIDNALKFSRDARPPTIDVGARQEADKVILWVRDNGIGFDMKFRDRIFEIFNRLQRTEEYAGTGVGLALVRKAMQRIGGKVWAESTPGQGATFFLELNA